MIIVRAALGHRIEDGAAVAPIFGRELIGDEPDLLNQVGIVERHGGAGLPEIVVVLAVDHEIIRTDAPTIGREADARGRLHPAARKGLLSRAQLAHARRRERNVIDVTIGRQRQLGDAL